MMARIYSSASEVIIWLGKKADNVDLAFEQLRTSHEAIQQHGDRYQPGSNAGRITHPNQSKSSTAMAMTALLERQWFRRTWVIQEAVLAKKATLMCGDLSLPFKSVTTVCSHWYKHNFRLITGLPVSRPLLAMSELQNGIEKKQNISLLAALMVTKGAESGDPRDRAFGLMSLVSANANPGIKVDYYMSCEELYAQIVKHDIDANERLVMLAFAGLGLFSGDVNLPSWVPDWSLCDNFFMDLMCNTGYKAAKETKPAVSWPGTGKARMKAVFIDEIVDTGTHMLPDGFDPAKAAAEGRGKTSHMDHWQFTNIKGHYLLKFDAETDVASLFKDLNHLTKDFTTYPTGEHLEDVKLRTVILDFTGLEKDEDWVSKYRTAYLAVQEDSNLVTMLGILSSSSGDSGSGHGYQEWTYFDHNKERYLRTIADWTRCRVLYSTKKGYIGWGSDVAQKGDKVFVLLGANVPFIVRPVGEGVYKLIGPSYIHGFMYGEALEGDYKEEDITLE